MAMMSQKERDATEKRQKEIADALESHGVTQACPRCSANDLALRVNPIFRLHNSPE